MHSTTILLVLPTKLCTLIARYISWLSSRKMAVTVSEPLFGYFDTFNNTMYSVLLVVVYLSHDDPERLGTSMLHDVAQAYFTTWRPNIPYMVHML